MTLIGYAKNLEPIAVGGCPIRQAIYTAKMTNEVIEVIERSIPDSELNLLLAAGFEKDIDDDQEYLDFFRYEDLTKEENIRDCVTFCKESGTYYPVIEIKSDNFNGYHFEAKDFPRTLPELLKWIDELKAKPENAKIIQDVRNGNAYDHM